MSALPNPLPSIKTPRKPAAKERKLNRYGRDPQSPSERMRVSDLDTLAPFAPLPISFLADIPRLTSGNSCTVLLMVLWSKSAGRGASKKGEDRPEWTNALAVADLAQICRCDERTIERELKALHERGLGEVKKEGKGSVSVRLLYRKWESLPDYKSPVVQMPDADEEPDDEKVEDSRPEGFQRLTGKKPMSLKAGAMSKPIPVEVGVKSVQFHASGSVDIEFVSVIQKGEQVVQASVSESFLESLRKQIASSNVSSNLTSGTRHARRGNGDNHSAVVKDHPRAGELAGIFDSHLSRIQARLLSADSAALQQACEAVGDTPLDFLNHFVNAPGGRGARPIKSPLTCVAIVKECRENWLKTNTVEQESTERDRLVTFLGLPRITRDGLKFGGLQKYVEACRKIVGDAECTQEQQNAARVLGRLLTNV